MRGVVASVSVVAKRVAGFFVLVQGRTYTLLLDQIVVDVPIDAAARATERKARGLALARRRTTGLVIAAARGNPRISDRVRRNHLLQRTRRDANHVEHRAKSSGSA